MHDILSVLEKAEASAKVIRESKPKPVSYATMAPGDFHRQGDVYFVALAGVPADCVPTEARAQLVQGATQGARHCLRTTRGVEFFERKNATALDGPVLRSALPMTVDHPEHGTATFPPGATIGVHYQRQYAEEMRRVAD